MTSFPVPDLTSPVITADCPGGPEPCRNRFSRRALAGLLLVVLLPVAAFLAFVAVQVLGALGSGAAGGCGGG
jgi:hypothetical protein